MEHSCSERVKDEKAPAMASPGFLAQTLEPLPQSSKGGRGQGARGSHGPMSQGRVCSELLCSLGRGSRAERRVNISSLGFYTLFLLLSADLFGGRICKGAANNGCSHFPAVRYLMTLTPQPPIFKILFYFIFFLSAQPAEELPAASLT